MQHIELYFDGASRSNPGPAGAGWLVKSDQGMRQTGTHYLGIATNNEAEYTGLVLALEWLIEHCNPSDCQVKIKGDSQLVIKQLCGEYAVRARHLRKFYLHAISLLSKFKRWNASWVPRSKNAIADELANSALDNRKTD
jgi:ribonuclease HI